MCWARHDLVHDARRWSARDVGNPEGTAANLRVSDADRQATIEQLRRHTADGRLTLEEFETRVEQALAARTGGDLRTVLLDLPPIGIRTHPRRRFPVPAMLLASPLVLVATLVVAVSLAAGHLVLWPLLVAVGFWIFGGCARGPRHRERRHHRVAERDRRDDALTMV